MINISNFINGKLTEPVGKNWMDNFRPDTGKVFSRVALSNTVDVEMAVEAASKAFPVWSNLSINKRSTFLHRIADLIDKNHEKLAQAECLDNGKPISLARRVDIPRASANFRFFANTIVAYESKSHQMSDFAINYTLRQPLGVVGCISPWNLPLYLFTWKIAPALAAGNTVVAKPSEITPYTAFLLSEIVQEAGLPEGVLNILHGRGDEVGTAIVSHPKIKAISFTGGTKTGRKITSIAAPMFKKLSLELGGKNPNIIFADCDLEKAVETSVYSSFDNQGEICLCGSRIFVEESIYEDFLSKFIEKTKNLKLGDPADPDTQIGAVVSGPHMEKVLSYIELAKEEGGKVELGGNRIIPTDQRKDGYYIEPTIISGLEYNCRTNLEEIFGPVVTVMPFKDEEEAIKYANVVEYGLSATIWTQNLDRAHRVAHQIEAGIVWINTWLLRDLRTPFGGIKNSGIGREGGTDVLDFFTEPKNVCIKYK